MKLLQLLIFRSFLSRPMRSLLCILGITIGVAGVLSIGITNQAAFEAISNLFEETSGRTNLIVTSATNDQGFSASIMNTVSNMQGVETSLPIVKAQTILADQATSTALELSFLGLNSGGLLVYGVDADLEPLARDYRITQGNFLSNDQSAYEICLVENYADQEDIEVGDKIKIITPFGIEELEVVGLMAREGPGQTNNGQFGVIPILAAQKMFDRSNEYDQIDLILTDAGGSQVIDQKRLDLQNRLGQAFAVTFPAGQGQRMTQMLYTYQIGLNFLSAIALFVGAFLIYNAFAMTVVERTREFGMLRTVGMSKTQIILQIISEAILLGIIGSALGVGLGIYGSRALTSLMGTILDTELNQSLTVPPTTLALSLFVGIFVTIIGAAMPAFQAGNISPIAALRIRGTYRETWLTKQGWKFGAVLVIVATVLLIINPFPEDPQFRAGIVTVFFMFTGVTLVIPATISIWQKISQPMFQKLYGNSGTIGSRNIQRAILRTTLTVGALLIGVSMIVAVQSVTASFSKDIFEWVDSFMGGDLYVHSSIPLRYDLTQKIGNLQDVQAATPINYHAVDYQLPDGKYEELNFMSIDVPTYIDVTSFIYVDTNTDENASLEQLINADAIYITSVMAEKYNLKIGDVMVLRTQSGDKSFRIANVVVDFYNEGLLIIGNWSMSRRYFHSNDVSAILIKVKEGLSQEEVKQEIDTIFGNRYNLTIESNTSLRKRATGLLDQAFSMFDVLSILAVFISAFGLVNTLTMNVMERMREIGMLRAIGMDRSQVIKMILAEAGLMGIIGGVLGLGFGILLSRIFLHAMIAIGGYRINFLLPISSVIIGLILALIVSQAAAIQPARRAATSNILEAVHYE